jgi:hypothetical protein
MKLIVAFLNFENAAKNWCLATCLYVIYKTCYVGSDRLWSDKLNGFAVSEMAKCTEVHIRWNYNIYSDLVVEVPDKPACIASEVS